MWLRAAVWQSLIALRWQKQQSNRHRTAMTSVRRRWMSTTHDDINDTAQQLCSAQTSSTRTMALAHRFCQQYDRMQNNDRLEFINRLISDRAVDHEQLRNVANRYVLIEDVQQLQTLAEKMRLLATPQFDNLILSIGNLHDGVSFVLRWRADIMQLQASSTMTDSQLSKLRLFDSHLRHALSQWFTTGMLQLHRVTWQSPSDVLELISTHEAVHPIRDWEDLRRRVGPCRRCYMFTHSATQRAPLVVLHVALTDKIETNINSVIPPTQTLQVQNESKCTTAIFYSISNAHAGLRGIDLGNHLIKRAVQELAHELPNVRTYSTLSPIPGFGRWLRMALKTHADRTLSDAVQRHLSQVLATDSPIQTFIEQMNSIRWYQDTNIRSGLRPVLMHLCAQYLCMEKHRGYALDSVANFHLRNGASLHQLNYDADSKPRALRNSCGMMVNYLYDINQLVENSEQYFVHKQLNANDTVLNMAKSFEFTLSLCAVGSKSKL